MTDDFKWNEIGLSHFECIPDKDFQLLVERLTEKLWWWCVYHKGKQVFTKKENVLKQSKFYCMGLCEGIYLGMKG